MDGRNERHDSSLTQTRRKDSMHARHAQNSHHGAFRSKRIRGGMWRTTPAPPRRVRRWCIAATCTALVILGTVRVWQVRDVRVDGTRVIPSAVLRDDALTIIAGHHWGIIPRASILTQQYRAIAPALRTGYALESVTLNLGRGSVLHVQVQEQPIAGILFTADGESLILSTQGTVIVTASPSVREAILAEDTEARLMLIRAAVPHATLGEQPYTSRQISVLQVLWTFLMHAGDALRPEGIIPKPGTTEDFDIMTVAGTTIIVTTSGEEGAQLSKLTAVLQDPQIRARQHELRSIDLRFGDRVYVQ